MRRVQRDAFVFGEEQLLDEPAVELADVESPGPVSPPGAGPAVEAEGPGTGWLGAESADHRLARVLSLDNPLRLGMLLAYVAAGVGIVAAIFGAGQGARESSRQAPVVEAPRGSTVRVPAVRRVPSEKPPSSRGSRSSEKERPQPTEREGVPTAAGGERSDDAAADPPPVPTVPIAPPPPDPAAAPDSSPDAVPASPEVVAKEFGP